MSKQNIEMEVPEGYELTGEYRMETKGDLVLEGDGSVTKIEKWFKTTGPKLILRKKTLKVITFTEVDSRDNASYSLVEGDSFRYGEFKGVVSLWAHKGIDLVNHQGGRTRLKPEDKIIWLRREEDKQI